MVVYFCQVKRKDGAPCTLYLRHKGRHGYCGHEEGFPEPVVGRDMKYISISKLTNRVGYLAAGACFAQPSWWWALVALLCWFIAGFFKTASEDPFDA